MAPKSVKTKTVKTVPKKVQKKVTKTIVSKQKAGGNKTSNKKKVVKKVVKKNSKKLESVKSVKKVRSFKVKLPTGGELYEGRFTGLTPYQAANKALSKYYRETNNGKGKIRFSIRESTRGSKRLVYHYNGYREKLKVPVEYVIKSGNENRTITKNYKNKLTKIKKMELAKLNLA